MAFVMEIYELTIKLLIGIAWPVTAIIIVLSVRKYIPLFLQNKNLQFKGFGIELLISELRKDASLTDIQRKDLEGLTANEIWALQTLKDAPMRRIEEMPSALKVMTKSLLETHYVTKKVIELS